MFDLGGSNKPNHLLLPGAFPALSLRHFLTRYYLLLLMNDYFVLATYTKPFNKVHCLMKVDERLTVD